MNFDSKFDIIGTDEDSMYEIDFYEDSHGNSDVKDYLLTIRITHLLCCITL